MGIPEKIKEIQDQIHRTQINKATEFHIGLLKAKIARLKREMEENVHGRTMHSGGENAGFDVRKAGDATVVLIGLPSVGKSTLLNRLTNARSRVASYQFTTLTAVPGMLHHRGSKIQVLDLPGIIEGASGGKGFGKRVMSVARGADLVLNKIDLVNNGFIQELNSKISNNFIPISADAGINIDALKEAIYHKLRFIRVYMRPKGSEADYNEPLIVKNGATMQDVCNKIHRNMAKNFRDGLVWGKSAKFAGQKVGLDHKLADEDVITIVRVSGIS